MNRRTFIKSGAMILGGLVASKAYAWPPLNSGMLGGSVAFSPTSVPWGSWDGLAESTLGVDQNNDGTEDTNVCFMENATASGDETSRGVQTGVNLIYTQHGSIVGATGTPPYRLLNGSTQYFSIPSATLATNIFSTAAKKWSVFVKCRIESTSDRTIFEVIDNTTPLNRIHLYANGGTGGISLLTQEASGALDEITTSDAYPTNTDLVIGAWADASGFVRAGFTTTITNMPFKLSDFASGRRCVSSVYTGNFSGINWAYCSLWGNYAGSSDITGRGYWSVMSNVCLVNNAA